MFNLEQSIAEWRRQMLAAGVKTPVPLEELESHLRDDVERQAQAGVGVEQAFEIAVQRIGQPAALQNEFAKGGRLQKLKSALLRFIGVPPPSPNAFTADVRETLELGRKEALGFHHDFIGTEHVLLGLLGLKAGVIRGILQRMGVDHKVVRSEIEKIVGLWPAQWTTRTPPYPYTPRARKAFGLAIREAKTCHHACVGPEHIFLGLLLEGDGVAGRVLKKLGVNIRTARQEILSEQDHNQRGA